MLNQVDIRRLTWPFQNIPLFYLQNLLSCFFWYVLGHHPFVLWRFRCFCQSLIWPGLHLVVNPLYLFSWSLLLIVDVDSDTSTSWRMFFTWLDVVKGFLYHGEDSPIIHHCCPPWTSRPFFMLLSSLVRYFFLRLYQTVDLATPNVPAISPMDLFCFWSITLSVSLVWRAPLTAWYGFTTTAFKCKWHTTNKLQIFYLLM